MSFTLYSAWRATAPYRVRIGLALKGVAFDYSPLDLIRGDQRSPEYTRVNRQRLTPALDIGEMVLTQSVAILEWLEEEYPDPPILPKAALDRQVARTMALIVACDIHPLNNTRVGRKLNKMGIDQGGILEWTQGWIKDGFDALEPMVERYGQGFAFGKTPTIADCCLIPQVYSANRYEVDLAPYPSIRAVAERAAEHPAFQAAHPNQQPDAVVT